MRNKNYKTMKEIKIPNSNLFLKIVNIGGTSKYTLDSDKAKLRYQFVVSEEGTLIHSHFTYGTNTILLGSTPEPRKLYFLEKSKVKFDKNIKLDIEDSITILKFLKEFAYYYPAQSEPLVMALRNKTILNEYRKSFGPGIKHNFISLISDVIKNPTQLGLMDSNIEFEWKGDRRKYSVINLLEELKSTGSKIKRVDYIIGYNNVSQKVIDKTKNKVEYLDKGGEILSISKSRTKLSLNITYKSFVDVTTPDGKEYKDFSIIKNLCIIKNGSLNTKKICIESTDKKFIGKLKRLGVVYTELISGTYILDLEKLPLITKNNIKSIQYWMLTDYEYYYQCYKFQKEYIKFKLGNSQESVPEFDLDNKVYNPVQVSRKSNSSYTTQVIETVIKDSQFPSKSSQRLIIFNNTDTLQKGTLVYNLINEIDNSSITLEDLLKEKEKETKKYLNLLKECIFSLIASKECKFRHGLGADVCGGNIKTVHGKYGELKLYWNTKVIKEYSYN